MITAQDFGLRANVAGDVKRAVRSLMVDALEDRVLHAEIVAAGPFRFRQVFRKDMGPYFANHRGPCDALADVVHGFLRTKWRDRYPDMSPGLFLDSVNIISPPTEREIEDAWELEIASDESALHQMYEGSARVRKGHDLGARTTKPVKES